MRWRLQIPTATQSSLPIVAGLLVAGLGGLSVSPYPFRPNTDDVRYIGLAFDFAHGAGLTIPGQSPPTGWVFPPGWPLLLAWLFAAGFSVPQVTLVGSIVGAASLGVAATLWSKIFAKRLGFRWGTLAGIWPLLSYPSLAIAPSAASDGVATALVAVLASWLDAEPDRECRPVSNVVVLSAGLAAVALTRTVLLFIWPAALWGARKRLSGRLCVLSALLATSLLAIAGRLTRPDVLAPNYADYTLRAWKENTSAAANILVTNWSHLGSLFSAFLLSPLPFSHRVVEAVGTVSINVAGWALAIALGLNALRDHRSGTEFPPLTTGPALLAVPFLCGYPYHFEPRFLIPTCAPLGFLAVALMRSVSGSRTRVAAALLCLWLGAGAVWWCRLARSFAGEQRAVLADATAILTALKAHERHPTHLCTREPEMLWAVDPESKACRLFSPPDEVASGGERQTQLVAQVLNHVDAKCVIDYAAQPTGQSRLPYALWGYRVQARSANFVAWCR